MQDTDWAPSVETPKADASAPTSPFAPKPRLPTASPASEETRLRSLRTQLTWVFGGLTAAIVLTLSLAFSELLQNRMQREAGTTLQGVSASAAQQLSDVLFEHSRSVQILASSAELWRNGLTSAEVQALFTRIQLARPYSNWIAVTDAQGNVVHASSEQLLGQRFNAATWFTAGLAGPYVSDVQSDAPAAASSPSKAADLRFVDFSAPIRVDGQLLGVLGMRTTWDWARDTLQKLPPTLALDKQVSVFVFDKQGQMIHAPGGQLASFVAAKQVLPFRPEQLLADQASPKLNASVVRWNDQEERFLTTVSKLPARNASSDLGWYVVARQPISYAYSGVQQLMLYVMGAGLLAAIAATALMWWLSRHMVRDLNTLTSAARRIDAGERDTPIPALQSNREVQQLASSFNAMTQRLLAANQSMEHEVQMRTQELYDANRELDRQASTDPLTGLLNRRGFDAQMQFAMALARRSGRPLSLMTLDIDHFKQVNDSFGHEVGDLVLKSVTNQLRNRLRDSDVVARFGGEEFVVLLPDTSTEDAQRIAREILSSVEQHQWPLVGKLTLSAGITALRPTLQNGTEDSEAAMLRRSDDALYQSKDAGRNQVSFIP